MPRTFFVKKIKEVYKMLPPNFQILFKKIIKYQILFYPADNFFISKTE